MRWLRRAAAAAALGAAALLLHASLEASVCAADGASALLRLLPGRAGALRSQAATAAAWAAAAPAPAARAAFSGRYLVSAAIDYGRFSNARASLVELVALAVALNRTAIVPPLECCRETSKTAAALFDTTAFAAPTLSAHAFDFDAACCVDSGGGSSDGGGGGNGGGGGGGGGGKASNAPGWLYVDSGASSFMSEEPSAFRGRMPTRLPGASLLEALHASEAVHSAACVVLSKHFRAVDWTTSSRPDALAAAHARLLPHATIAAEARGFLLRRGLAGPAARPFLGVHLRQTDFLRPGHHSFASACNENPELLLAPVRAAVAGGAMGGSRAISDLVLATDDYETPCARAVLAAFPRAHAHGLARATHFPRGSCEEALLDQEVLGLSASFVGDAVSTFSAAVAAIRVHRGGFGAETTTLLAAPS